MTLAISYASRHTAVCIATKVLAGRLKRVLSFDARQEHEIFLRVQAGSRTLSVSYTIFIMDSLSAVKGAEALGQPLPSGSKFKNTF